MNRLRKIFGKKEVNTTDTEIAQVETQVEQVIRSDEKTFMGLKANPAVFFTSFLIVASLVIGVLTSISIFGAENTEIFIGGIQGYISQKAGWFFILVIHVVLLFCIWLMFSRYGSITLGGEGAKPDFSYLGWFSMLFSAGMGIGLLFFGVAEPLMHFESSPLLGYSENPVIQAQNAMSATFLHWGIHAWALYAVVGLALAYFTFNKKLPLTIRSVFYPLFGDKIHGWRGDVIDIISVIATLFGLATSLGLGAGQVNQGLGELFGLSVSISAQIVIIAVVTLFATVSLLLGLDKGIRFLSEWNMRLAMLLLAIIVVLGPTLFIFGSFFQNLGYYAANFIEIGLWSGSYDGILGNNSWHTDWTIFYWAWWIAWCPFVGIFIARVSRGRTIREFLMGVVLVPSILVFFWFTAMGGTALFFELSGDTSVSDAIANSGSTIALYSFLQHFPFYPVIAGLATLLVASFFVTSSDSGSYVVDTLTSGGRHNAPKFQKIFWASMEGLVAAILLIGGGLKAMQAATISLGILFGVIVLIMCYSLYITLKDSGR